ncbi:hypothetical protein GGX14DRAFT_557010 [Mycena pura]|uniref:Uncharacterized protein n=1 Tax=Mycena pura TaxID=153505 RepID=A0AAD6YMS0_9AGAR|nr:hypothetical protein GGX14DRAFT_557010 [Mycena pura]
MMMVSDDQIAYIRDTQTAVKMWNNLHTIYQHQGMQSIIVIHDKILAIKYRGIESGPLQDYLDIIQGYAGDLKHGNDPLSDYKLLQYILKSLPFEFTSLLQSISITGHTYILTVTPVLLEEKRFGSGRSWRLNIVKNTHLKRTRRNLENREDVVVVVMIGSEMSKVQLKEKLCLAQVAYDGAIGNDKQPKVLLTKKATNGLCANSGSSRNLTSERASFMTYTVLNKPIPIKLGNDSKIHAVGTGTSAQRIKSPTGVQMVHFIWLVIGQTCVATSKQRILSHLVSKESSNNALWALRNAILSIVGLQANTEPQCIAPCLPTNKKVPPARLALQSDNPTNHALHLALGLT